MKSQGKQEKYPSVYMLSNQRNGAIYVGVTSNLLQRVWQHKNNIVRGFTYKYQIHTLVYYEVLESMESAIEREKQIKGWNRRKKLMLIEKENPEWKDLYKEL